MSLPFTVWGSLKRSAGIFSALGKQAQLVNYGAAKKVTFKFDPFYEVDAIFNTRRALVYMNNQKQRATNPKCIVRTEVISDRSPPSMTAILLDGKEVIFKTENLSTLEILTFFNELVSSKAPKKEVTTGPVLQTKAEKAATTTRRRK